MNEETKKLPDEIRCCVCNMIEVEASKYKKFTEQLVKCKVCGRHMCENCCDEREICDWCLDYYDH